MALDQQASVAQGINKFGSTLFEAVDVDVCLFLNCFNVPTHPPTHNALLSRSPNHKKHAF